MQIKSTKAKAKTLLREVLVNLQNPYKHALLSNFHLLSVPVFLCLLSSPLLPLDVLDTFPFSDTSTHLAFIVQSLLPTVTPALHGSRASTCRVPQSPQARSLLCFFQQSVSVLPVIV